MKFVPKLIVRKNCILAFVTCGLLFFTQVINAQNAAANNWQIVRQGGTGDLVSVYFTSSNEGWIGGDEGYLAVTNDGGKSWTRQILNTRENINEIYFRNDENGYVLAGRRIFLSKNGGKTWRENIVINSNDYNGLQPEFLSIRFTDKKRGWIVGSLTNKKDEVVDSLVLHTIDSGETWTRVVVPAKQELYHLDFADDANGWIVGDKGLILATTDGGNEWRRQTSGTTVSLYNIDFRDSRNGVAVGSGGTILFTETGGIKWEKVRSPEARSLLRINFTDDKSGWIVGGGGTILRTSDKGRTWVKQNNQMTESLYGLFMDKKGGWAVGRKGLVLRFTK